MNIKILFLLGAATILSACAIPKKSETQSEVSKTSKAVQQVIDDKAQIQLSLTMKSMLHNKRGVML